MILNMHYYSNGQGNLNLMTDLYLSCNCHSSHWPKLGMQGVGSASTKRLHYDDQTDQLISVLIVDVKVYWGD